MKSDELLAWIDIETTGLDVMDDSLLEVALLVTDQNDRPIHEESWVLFHRKLSNEELLQQYHPIVVEMHSNSGLWDECVESKWSTCSFERNFQEVLGKILYENPQYTKFVMAGSGVARFDYTFFQFRFPKIISQFFNYYTLDVGVIRRALELAGAFSERDDETPVAKLEHRALMDIQDHWNEWLYYRGIMSAWFLDGPIEDLRKQL